MTEIHYDVPEIYRGTYFEAPYLAVKKRWDSISKPLDGLGDFEDLICRIGALQGTDRPHCAAPGIMVMCADNGIVDEGVAQCDRSVTLNVAKSIVDGVSTVNMMAKPLGVDVLAYNVGIDASPEEAAGIPTLSREHEPKCTKNFLKEPAMTEEEYFSVQVGSGLAAMNFCKNHDLVIIGEMGIGNTTTAAACLCALLGLDPEEVVGRGAGLDDAKLARKKEVVAAALRKYKFHEIPDIQQRAKAILRTVGGYDIVAMVGAYVECSGPVVIDGAISAVAALFAETLKPRCKKLFVASHQGREKALEIALKHLGLKPYIAGNMALGEGTGALMLIPLIHSALDLYNNGRTFDEAQVPQYKRFES